MRLAVQFDQVLDAAEMLPFSQQEDMVRILSCRLREQKRADLVSVVQEARVEYARGDVKVGTVEDLMKDLNG